VLLKLHIIILQTSHRQYLQSMIDSSTPSSSKNLIGSYICTLSFNEQIDLIMSWATQRQSRMVYVANVHMLIEAWQNSHFAGAMRSADLVTPDGAPLVWMLRLMGSKRSERVAGMDIFRATCERAAQGKISIFLLGSKPEVLDRICQRLQREFPTLKIAGVESPPFRPLGLTPNMEVVKTINSSGAGLVFVALGCPKQELWMAQHREHISAVLLGIGGVFPVYAGTLKQAPQILQKAGLEWLFRLAQEPQRLWKRYAVTIPIFIWLSLKQLWSEKMV
jgi:N-acetylglucosaminyldiphosphoundecaprenol N-acetyl-beta-D-mannosaminyltransferase